MKQWTLLLAGLVLVGCAEAPSPSEGDQKMQDADTTAPIAEDAAAASAPFVSPDFEVPIRVPGDGFELVPLGPELVDIDYEAYMSSIEHLQKTFTRSDQWPRADLNAADAMLDMETEQGRFARRESFAYGVLTPDGTRERGSVYVKPSSKAGYDAEVALWVTQADFDAGFDPVLYAWVQQWVSERWPFDRVAYPGRAIDWATWDALPSAAPVDDGLLSANIATAEAFIDAFYSFDPDQLKPFLAGAPDSAAALLYYQGWAQGGNYKVLERAPCAGESAATLRCAVTVQDDPVLALQTGFNVTDTFTLTFSGPSIVAVETSSNDQPVYYEARDWVVANMPEVMEGPCAGYFAGGETPGDCARAMTAGYRQFYQAKLADGSSAGGPESG